MAKWMRTAWVAALALGEPVNAADSFADLQASYRCEVVRRLERIHATGDPKVDLNRYLAISIPDQRSAYVQCIFHDIRTRVHCEAASRSWKKKHGERRAFQLSARAVAALAKLGFDTDDPAINFTL